jgi:hypothetical protein
MRNRFWLRAERKNASAKPEGGLLARFPTVQFHGVGVILRQNIFAGMLENNP